MYVCVYIYIYNINCSCTQSIGSKNWDVILNNFNNFLNGETEANSNRNFSQSMQVQKILIV